MENMENKTTRIRGDSLWSLRDFRWQVQSLASTASKPGRGPVKRIFACTEASCSWHPKPQAKEGKGLAGSHAAYRQHVHLTATDHALDEALHVRLNLRHLLQSGKAKLKRQKTRYEYPELGKCGSHAPLSDAAESDR